MKRKTSIYAFAEGAAFTGPACITGTICAILSGGPGSLFWMAAAGLVSWLVSRKLAFIQRTRPNSDGFFSYAPKRLIAVLFILAAVFIGAFSLNQAGLSLTRACTELSLFAPAAVSWTEISGIKAFFTGAVPFRTVASLTGLLLAACLLFFRKKASLTGFVRKILKVLPLGLLMIYAGMCLYIIVTHPGEIVHAAGRIVKYGFQFKGVFGGIFSYTLLHVIRTGFPRGLLISPPFEELYDDPASRAGSSSGTAGSSGAAGSSGTIGSSGTVGSSGTTGSSGSFLLGKFLFPVLISLLTGFMILTSMNVEILQGQEDIVLYTLLVFRESFGTFGTVAVTAVLCVLALTAVSRLTAGAGNAFTFLTNAVSSDEPSVSPGFQESPAEETHRETLSLTGAKKQKSPSRALLPVLFVVYLVLIFVLSAAKSRFLLSCCDLAVLAHFLVCLVTLFRTLA